MSDQNYASPDGMMLTPDFSEARDRSLVPGGDYPCRIIALDGPVWPKGSDPVTHLKDNGEPAYPMMIFKVEIIDLPGHENHDLPWFYASMAGPYAGFSLAALQAFNPDYTKGDPINKAEWTGLTAIAVVEEGIYNNPDTGTQQKTNNIARFRPYKP